MKNLGALIESMKSAATLAQAKGVQIDKHLGKTGKEVVAGIDSWAVSVRAGDLLRVLDELERRDR